MNLKSLFKRSKDTVEERGGAESLNPDASELKEVASSGNSTTEKAEGGTDAVTDPGAAEGPDQAGGAAPG